MKKTEVKKITDLKDKIEAYRASALAAGNGRKRGPARLGNLALASAAAGGAALAMAPAAEAVIQHSGPQNIMLTDATGSPYAPTSFTINLDGDLFNDLKINHFHPTYYFNQASVELLNGASVLASYRSYYLHTAKALISDYNIANTLGNWRGAISGNGTNVLGAYNATINGNFDGQGNRYLGVQFTNFTSNQRHFGWVQINVAANTSSLKIVDWAWEDTPGVSILAGAGAPQPQAEIPTLNEWGIIVLMTLLAGAAAWKMNKPELLQA